MNRDRKLARICNVLSADSRLRIVQLLKGRVLCVGALSDRMDITQGAVSQHLRVLPDADLVVAEKRGCYMHYRLNTRTLSKWKDAIGRLLEAAPSGRKRRPAQCRQSRRKPCATKRKAASIPRN